MSKPKTMKFYRSGIHFADTPPQKMVEQVNQGKFEKKCFRFMSIIELDTLFYAPKTSSLQPQRASRSIRGKVFLNGCPLTLGKCVFRACVTKYPYPPPVCFMLRPDLVGFFLLFPHNFELKSSLRAFPNWGGRRSLSQTGPNSQFFRTPEQV